jgi:hypothetical protein
MGLPCWRFAMGRIAAERRFFDVGQFMAQLGIER